MRPHGLLLAILSSVAVASSVKPEVDVDNNALLERRGLIGGLLKDLTLVTSTILPTTISAAIGSLSNIAALQPTSLIDLATNLVEAGLAADKLADVIDFVQGFAGEENSMNNTNEREPESSIYPLAGSEDAPYSIPEAQLRAAIHIPATFRYGDGVQPIVLVPGTGNTGYTSFAGNFIPLLVNSSVADPVWLNIPGYLNGDSQLNAEYVAYAINYISSITNQKIAVGAWSQGGFITQWATKYWPSIRSQITDIVAFSPDYKGTTISNLITNLDVPFPRSYYQQAFNSSFVSALRAGGGDSAYVPTTTVHSGLFDVIVQPQSGTEASAFLRDERGVGVSNHEVQEICSGQPAGGYYGHAGVLYNLITYALLVDALSHEGPGRVERISEDVCEDYLTAGLNLASLKLTENAIVLSAVTLLLEGGPPVTGEPTVRDYAL
ncbi:Lipase B [Fulvia fulva]|nr:Lipase B [Fulvia fulva]